MWGAILSLATTMISTHTSVQITVKDQFFDITLNVVANFGKNDELCFIKLSVALFS